MLSALLDDTLDFEESLEVVNLPEGHDEEDGRFEDGPHHHSGVCALVDRAMDAVAHLKSRKFEKLKKNQTKTYIRASILLL